MEIARGLALVVVLPVFSIGCRRESWLSKTVRDVAENGVEEKERRSAGGGGATSGGGAAGGEERGRVNVGE